jgi:hypothetical protein
VIQALDEVGVYDVLALRDFTSVDDCMKRIHTRACNRLSQEASYDTMTGEQLLLYRNLSEQCSLIENLGSLLTDDLLNSTSELTT